MELDAFDDEDESEKGERMGWESATHGSSPRKRATVISKILMLVSGSRQHRLRITRAARWVWVDVDWLCKSLSLGGTLACKQKNTLGLSAKCTKPELLTLARTRNHL